MSIPKTFVPISSLPPTPGAVTDGMLFMADGGSDSYRVLARQLVLPADPLITMIPFPSIPGSRYLDAGVGISIVDGGPGGAVTISVSSAGTLVVFNLTVTATVGSDQNDWDPAGWDAGLNKNRLEVTPSTLVNLTGLDSSGAVDGQMVVFINDSATNIIRLHHQSGSSAPGNRFSCPGGATFAVVPFQAIQLMKQGTNGWRIFS